MSDWQPMETIPKEPIAKGWRRGPLVYVKPPWGGWDIGCWEISPKGKNGGCVRMFGDDGSYDEQPTHWMPLPSPPA